MSNDTVARTIIQQMGGMGKLKAMVNARSFAYYNNSVHFRFSGSKKMNCVNVELKWDDTYTVTFYKIGRVDFKEVKQIEGVYCDMLIDIFESNTGLYLSLGNVRMMFA